MEKSTLSIRQIEKIKTRVYKKKRLENKNKEEKE